MSALRLFGSRVSPFVEKVVRALALKQVDYELVEPRTPLDFRRWSPQTGKLPVLEIGGERVWDSTFILRRIDVAYPTPPLFSSDPLAAAQQRLLEDWADESLYWYVMAVRWLPEHAAATSRQITDMLPVLARPLARLIVSRQIPPTTRAQGLGRLPAQELVTEFGRRLDDLVRLLGDLPFFFAAAPGAADCAVYGQLVAASSGPTPELARLIHHRPALAAWLERVTERAGG